MLSVTPQSVYADSTGAFITLRGPPNRAVTWSLASGDGTLTPITNFTNAQGGAAALYKPGTAGTTAVIEVRYGA